MNLETLFEHYHDEIYRYLWRACFDSALAQDITQETFLKAFKNLPKLAPDSNYRAWLYRVASNALRDHFRREKRLTTLDTQALATHENIEADYQLREKLEWVVQAVQALPEKQGLALILIRYEGMSYTEAAAILDCSEESARANVYQATKKLRAQFEEV